MKKIWVYYKNFTNDHFIEIQDHNKNTQKFSIEKEECTDTYAMLMALTSFLEEIKEQEVEIHCSNLMFYNILNSYLFKWQSNNWFMSKGKPVAYIDILQNLYNVIVEKNIKINCIFG